MIRHLFAMALACALVIVKPVWAAPLVATDIPAINSLVATVLGDNGEPELLLRSGASPHDYALRPSEARLLRKADLIVWTGASLTPWLPKAMDSLAPDLESLELLADEHSIRLPARESAEFHHIDHHHDHDDDGDSTDPHGWLSTDNARLWLQLIADRLSALDPINAASYQGNAELGIQALNTLDTTIESQFDGLRGNPFVVFHDSYHYFEDQYELPATAAISLSDGTQSGIRQLDRLRDLVSEHPGICVFSEPQFSERMVDTIAHDLDVRRGVLDPLGSDLQPGASLYGELMRNLANTLTDCLSGKD
ncbi:zinc ABC transporter substrate-binding protein [Granulosicoccus sp. 3-233]|uniref:zinc ABC transporter substrate-binding protein n=1 Tax=Granulosicoccus sp. 3-233 TaxID=3417969 RepID=UPI003D3488B4